MKINKFGNITIEWGKDAPLKKLTTVQICRAVEFLAQNHHEGYVFCKNSFNKNSYTKILLCAVTNDKNWHQAPINWCLDSQKNEIAIFLRNKNGFFRIFSPQFKNSSHRAVGGYAGIKALSAEVQKVTGKSLQELAGAVNGKRDFEKMHFFKTCQYRPMIFTKISQTGKILVNFNKIDVSSAYPSVAGTLPDLHTAKKCTAEDYFKKKYYVEYPIGFFEKSMRVFEYNVFDSKKILQHKWYGKIFPETVATHSLPDGDCICMKRTCDISEAWRTLYKKRKIDESVKSAMVSSIGFMQSEKYAKNFFFGHCSAVIYLRHIQKMLDKIDEIEKNGGEIVNIATDSISWVGCENAASGILTEKKIGKFVWECRNGIACIKCNGVLAYSQGDAPIVCKHQGCGNAPEITNVMQVMNLQPAVNVIKFKEKNKLIIPYLKKYELSDAELLTIDGTGS